MKRHRLLGSVFLMLCLATVLVAQQPQLSQTQPATAAQQGASSASQAQPRQLSRVYFVVPKPGMELQFEKAMRGHLAWHKQKNDKWRWDVRYTDTGRRTGEYIFISGGHQWTDFDNPPVSAQEDGEHFYTHASQFVQSSTSLILQTRPDLSRGDPNAPQPPIMAVTYFYLKYGKTMQFEEAVKQITDALNKANHPVRSAWAQVVSSGRNATFVLTTPRQKWADFSPANPSVRQTVESAYGKAQADAIFKAMEESVDFTEAKITVSRPDLSYTPGS